jgi:hypothetical protein
MGKLANRSGRSRGSRKGDPVARLRREQRQLSARLARINAALDKALGKGETNRSISTAAQVDRWLNELTDGLSDLPAIPADFSRADLYDDHD